MESLEYYRNAAEQAFEHAIRVAEEADHAAQAARHAAQASDQAALELQEALEFYGEE